MLQRNPKIMSFFFILPPSRHFSNDSSVTISTPDRSVIFIITANDSIGSNETLNGLGVLANKSLISHNEHLLDYNRNSYYVAGHPAIRSVFTAHQFNPILGQIQERVLQFLTIINGKGYSLGYVSPDTKFSDYSSIFAQMVYSFKTDTNATQGRSGQSTIIHTNHAQNQTLACTRVQSCYEQGYAQGQANPGTSCTETQKEIQTDNYINYCAGYSDGSGLTTVTPSTGDNSGGNQQPCLLEKGINACLNHKTICTALGHVLLGLLP